MDAETPVVPADVAPVLQRFSREIIGPLCKPPEPFLGFSGAAVYRIVTAIGTFALRQWRQAALNLARLRGLHRLLKSIRESGVATVAVPVRTIDGETFVSHNERYWQLEPWLPGTADYHLSPSQHRLRNAMTALADWHRAARSFHPHDSEREWFRSESATPSPAVRNRLEKLQDWQSGRLAVLRRSSRTGDPHSDSFRLLGEEISRLFDTNACGIAAELRSVLDTRVRLQPCLRDVWHDHVLFTGDEVTGLIDATACRTENTAGDLARLLGSLIGDDAAEWRFALDAYHAVAPLTDEEFRLVRILDRSAVLLNGLTWLDRYFLQQSTFPDPTAVVQRLQRIVERLRRL